MKHAAGLEAIIVYKLVKAAVEAVAGILLVVLLVRGAEASAATIAQMLMDHASGAWTLGAATAIVRTGTSRHVRIAGVFAFADAALSAIEGLALQADRWWAPWLVVIATSALLPVEVVELWRKPGWTRAAVLLANLAMVAYLLREVVRKSRR